MILRLTLTSAILCLSILNAQGENPTRKIGTNAPAFTLQDQNGRNVTLQELIGKIVVLEWFDPDCDYTKRDILAATSKTLSEKYKEKGVIWLAVDSTRDSSGERDKAWRAQNQWTFDVLHDANKAVAKAFGVSTVPYFAIVDQNGTVVYLGIGDNDDSRKGEKKEGKINLVDKALEEMTAGKAVTARDSRPYGCPLR